MGQMFLFPREHSEQSPRTVHGSSVPVERFEGALIFSAVGDALGWPTEFGHYPAGLRRRADGTALTDFVSWKKVVGGRFWGYEERINAGEYSDDTQLTLAVARCIDKQGRFDANKFAYLELPLWLAYEKGGGRSIKAAARSLIRVRKNPWPCTFYRQRAGEQIIDYRQAGANGAAMRVLPIVLAHAEDADDAAMLRDAFHSAVITHGHPRALLGCLLHAGMLWQLLRRNHLTQGDLLAIVGSLVERVTIPLRDLEWLQTWLKEWDSRPPAGESFRDVFEHTRAEAREYLAWLSEVDSHDLRAFYSRVGAAGGEFKGSGLSTVFAALFIFLKYYDEPEAGIIAAVNALGSDTDTISAFAGALFGAHYGLEVVPARWKTGLQDIDCFLQVARRLHRIASGQESLLTPYFSASGWQQLSSLLSVYSWETRFFDLFFESPEQGELVVHPALGIGEIVEEEIRPLLKRPDYEVHLVRVAFHSGQVCTFHARVATQTGMVSESENLSSEIEHNPDVSRALRMLA